MRLLHTADWHLGRSLYAASLAADQEVMLGQVLAELENGYDGLLLAGDVYDRAIPPPESVRAFSNFLTSLAALNIPAAIISGNHDSPSRLGFADRVLESTGVHIRSQFTRLHEPVRFTDSEGLHTDVFCLPFVETGPVQSALDRPDIGDFLAATEAALDQARSGQEAGVPSILMGHAYVTGGQDSESERELFVGNSGQTPAELFAGFDYVALGHLHRPQSAGSPTIRYSGSLMPYSFSEAEDEKQMLRLDVQADGQIDITSIPLTPPRDIVVLKDSLENLLTQPRYDQHQTSYVKAVLTDTGYVLDPMPRLRDRFHQLLHLEQPALKPSQDIEIAKTSATKPADLLSLFLEQFDWDPADQHEAMLILEAHLQQQQAVDREGAVP